MKKILIIIVIIILVGFGLYALNSETEPSAEKVNQEASQQTSSSDKKPEVSNGSQVSGAYESYSPEKLSEDSDKNIVIFFKADWCPSCRALDRDIQANSSDIPEDLAILELDYDSETELKKKYGVTVQHTLLLVNSNGELIEKWSGGNRLESIIDKVY